MKSVLIVENNTSPLSLNENLSSNDEYVMEGEFTRFDIKNRNERIYKADKFLPCLEELNERMKTLGVVYGEFDHPDVFDTSMKNASHRVLEGVYNKELDRVDGKIQLLSTTETRPNESSLISARAKLFSQHPDKFNPSGNVEIQCSLG